MDPAAHGPQIRARLGVVPQQDTLDTELTVRENLVDLRPLLRPEPGGGRAGEPTSCSSSPSSPNAPTTRSSRSRAG